MLTGLTARPLALLIFIVAVVALAIVFTPGDSTTTPAGASLAQAQTVKWGDSNCDGSVALVDMLAVLADYASLAQDQIACEQGLHVGSAIGAVRGETEVSGDPADDYRYAGYWGDYTCDRSVDPYDAMAILYEIAGVSRDIDLGCYEIGYENDIYLIDFGSQTPGQIGAIEVDTNTDGNTANSVGPTEKCREVATSTNFTVDVVVKNLPALQTTSISQGGLSGFQFNVLYDADVINPIGIDVRRMLTIGSNSLVTYNDPVPDGDGSLQVSAYDLGYNFEAGSGVLVRLTLRAVGAGVSNLTLGPTRGDAGVTVIDRVNWIYNIGTVDGAQIAVNSPGFCPIVPTPTTTAEPTPTAMPTPTPGPSGNHECLNEDPPTDIPDNDPGGIEVSRVRGGFVAVGFVFVCLNVAAQWAGDIVVTLTHEETGTTRTLVSRLGNSAGTCNGGGNGIYVYLTDFPPDPQESLEDACSDGSDIIGTFFPNQPFVSGVEPHFGGEVESGTWTLKISDEGQGGTAQLRGWELYINDSPQ